MGHRRRTVLGLALLLAAVLIVLGVRVTGSGSGGGSRTDRSAQASPSNRSAAHRRQAAYFGRPTDGPVRRLGIIYGPYLGRRCAPPARRNCERVGIDVVFGHAATRVVAVAGSQKIHLRTPGEHSGIRHRDWVGTFTRAGFPRPAHDGDGNVVSASVELRARFADGRRVAALFEQVPLLPGWG